MSSSDPLSREVSAQLVREAGCEALIAENDVADPEQNQRMVDLALEHFGQIAVLVDNAGVGTARSAVRETPEQFRQVVDVNLNGSYWAAQACGQVMEPGSAIIDIASIIALTTAGLPQAGYSASEAGVIGLTRDLAGLRRRHIRHLGHSCAPLVCR